MSVASSAVERDAEGYLADEEIADVAAHWEAEDAQVEQDDGDDDGNDDGGDGGWNLDYENCADKLLRLAVKGDAEGYLAYEEIADVAAHREAEDAQVEQDDGDDDGDDDGNDDGGDGGWNLDYENCADKLLRLAVKGDAEGYLADEEIADVAAHREAEDAQVEQDDGDDDGDDDGNDDGGDGGGGNGGTCGSSSRFRSAFLLERVGTRRIFLTGGLSLRTGGRKGKWSNDGLRGFAGGITISTFLSTTCT
ncbi:hypothetical protein, conserved [Babesia bigemina]|uniref:Uncharacterized protein n=1 Tax=Babesia bigemina TaxID=5866 RepID=A0A061BPS6_BABBI|nr:hypothetical protein, conserved [Babesia bigemina]CDR71497.1 hypothetical protein, conserved [Babesia bigemina]|eukprot:XP_012770443.1 hypothetical protein, conserved [Babesia bigemina]